MSADTPPRAELAALGKRIRALRVRKGLTQQEFAARGHISVSFASLLERGERSPSYETLVDVAAALEVAMVELFREIPIERADDPYYGRLVEYAQRARLTRAQVDRLIAMAQVMFGPLDQTRPHPSEAPTCTVDGCGRAILARGLCASHYHRARRASS